MIADIVINPVAWLLYAIIGFALLIGIRLAWHFLFYVEPEEYECRHCQIGTVTQCGCGCGSHGHTTYVCDNPDCDGDDLQILGV